MADLFEEYVLGQAWDEMFAAPRQPRPSYEAVHDALQPLASGELRARADSLARTFLDQGVTFDIGGEERPFPLDIIPRVVDAADWQHVAAGVRQRVGVIEAFLADIYDGMQAVRDGVIPRSLVLSSRNFQRAVAGLEPPNGVRVHVAGIDLIRDGAGTFRILEDNVRVPSGVSYVMENRRAMTQVFPEAFATHRIQPVAQYPQQLLAALRAAAPTDVDDPVVVVLTPGVYNAAYFEHALLARSMGVELVEGRDLVCSGNRVRMRTTWGDQRVDVIYRRVDDDFLDPVHFRADSTLGCPGLLNAARAGNVTIANAVGNGVADDKLVYSYMPDLTRYYLQEEPILANVETFRLAEPDARAEALDRLGELVFKPVDGAGGKGIVIGTHATVGELAALRTRILENPRGWIAQPVVQLSTVPTLIDEAPRPRHVDLRPFAVNDGESIWVLPGGLTRVALPEGELVVNSSQGGGSKDTWVLSDPAERDEAPAVSPREARAAMPPVSREPDVGPDIQQQQQQQQQQQARSRRIQRC